MRGAASTPGSAFLMRIVFAGIILILFVWVPTSEVTAEEFSSEYDGPLFFCDVKRVFIGELTIGDFLVNDAEGKASMWLEKGGVIRIPISQRVKIKSRPAAKDEADLQLFVTTLRQKLMKRGAELVDAPEKAEVVVSGPVQFVPGKVGLWVVLDLKLEGDGVPSFAEALGEPRGPCVPNLGLPGVKRTAQVVANTLQPVERTCRILTKWREKKRRKWEMER